MCLMHNGKLKERLQFKAKGQNEKNSAPARPHPPNPKRRLSSWVKETVVWLNVVTAEGILPACRPIRKTVGGARSSPRLRLMTASPIWKVASTETMKPFGPL